MATCPHLTPSSASLSSSMSSLLSSERTLSVKGNSTASLSSVKESRSASAASTSTATIQHSSMERTSSLREGRPVQRVPSVSSLKSTHSVGQKNASPTVTETNSTSPQQHRKTFRTASSSSSSSSSLFPYQLSTSSSLTSLHISEDYKSCHGSVQSLMSLDPQEAAHMRKTSHVRCGSDLTAKLSAAATSSNGYQKPGSVLSVRVPQRESSVFSSALDICSTGREAKALYSCEAEHSHELSFPQGALFLNVHPSVEPGWLQATYNGKTGLIPENYIAYM
ncbi:Rho GTPase-activating protein 42 [Collichthys lucidus]|uniref:Rho GTPase-activating protein 42 n=1 Tax=Collichthys lucidus TaxID=240159 RepID=A0A4U5V536_COLLU|nr:Rho GTPase-activating protein 42 [Collichthys lucidus]